MTIQVFTNIEFLSRYSSEKIDFVYLGSPVKELFRSFIFRRTKNYIVVNGLNFTTYIFLLVKAIRVTGLKVIILDPIFVKPSGPKETLIAKLKGFLLNHSEVLLTYAKNNIGASLYFGIDYQKFQYIPFKVNSLSLIQKRYLDRESKGYVFSGGRSRRDYATLVSAAKLLPNIQFIIVSPLEKELIEEHCQLYQGPLPENVSVRNDNGTAEEFIEVLSESEMVVLVATEANIAPAGISVYLVAMSLKKPVIITEGPAVDGIIDESMAVIVPLADVDALKSAIETTYYNRELKCKIGEAGYKYALSLGGEKNLFISVCDAIQSISKK